MSENPSDAQAEPLKFTCPNCAQHLEASPDMAGDMLECPSCNKEIAVPSPPRQQPPSSSSDSNPKPPPQNPLHVGVDELANVKGNPKESKMTPEERFARLERNNRRLLIGLVSVILLAGLGFLFLITGISYAIQGGRTQTSGGAVVDEVRARRFTVVDKNGKTSALLVSTEDGPMLILTDENGKIRAMLAVPKEGPLLELYDQKQKTRVTLNVTENDPELRLRDKNGTGRVRLEVSNNGPMLGLYDETAKPRVALLTPEDGASLSVFNTEGKVRASLRTEEDNAELRLWDENSTTRIALMVSKDGPLLGMSDENGKPRAGLIETKDGSWSLNLYDKSGKQTWRTP